MAESASMPRLSSTATDANALRSSRRQRALRHMVGRATIYALLIILALLFSLPLYWLLSTALKTDDQLLVFPPRWIPNPIRWQNFADGWRFAPFDLYLMNTMTITGFALVGQVLSACMVAYGFARLRFPWRDQLFMGVLATMMLPGIVTLIPIFLIFKTLGWINTFLPLIVPAYFGGGPFFIFMLRQYFRTIPQELSDAARMDGAGELTIFFRVIAPLSLPAIATVAIFSFMGHWNDFMGPLIYLNDQSKRTLTLGLGDFIGEHTQNFQYLMAVSLLISLPSMLIFFLFQRLMIRSIALTGLKG